MPGGATLARAYKIVGRVNGVPPGNQWALSRPFYSNTMMQAHSGSLTRSLDDDVLSPGDNNARHQHENPAQGLP
ncbi:hypothetical protein CX680_15635 [Klebsiella pneumoniae]|nr:hypothetical protein CX680_15635 [Klebsiella pneumoniae]